MRFLGKRDFYRIGFFCTCYVPIRMKKERKRDRIIRISFFYLPVKVVCLLFSGYNYRNYITQEERLIIYRCNILFSNKYFDSFTK